MHQQYRRTRDQYRGPRRLLIDSPNCAIEWLRVTMALLGTA